LLESLDFAKGVALVCFGEAYVHDVSWGRAWYHDGQAIEIAYPVTAVPKPLNSHGTASERWLDGLRSLGYLPAVPGHDLLLSERVVRMWFPVVNATAYAVAMAYLESTIVVYLRRLYYPRGFDFPLIIIDTPTLLLELGREAATIVMLATVGIAAGRTSVGKFAYFLYMFGVWDIFYYVWLKVFLDWPASLLTWDVLFLIPVPWVGPALAPVTVAVTMMGMGLILLRLEQRGPVRRAGSLLWLSQVVASLMIIVSFTMDVVPRLPDQGALLAQWTPAVYRWWMLGLGQCLALSTFGVWAWRAATMPASPNAPAGSDD